MKEYLSKNSSGNYQLVNHRFSEDDIVVPEGAKYMTMPNKYFWRDESPHAWSDSKQKWTKNNGESMQSYIDGSYSAKIVWQRESLNDKIASAEVARQGSKNIDATLAERQSQYGSFTSVANTTGQLMAVIRNSPNGHTMPYAHEEALHMICSKIARIVNGDFNHLDSWHDIGGYSKLIEDLIGDNNEI